MKTITAEELEQKRSAVLDDLADGDVLITRGGKIVARLSAVAQGPHAHLIGCLKGKARLDPNDDLFSTGITWDAERGKWEPES
jgi:antitoxin (DNA-binding transcriptional repressor) of toxin-antitoxin stability system